MGRVQSRPVSSEQTTPDLSFNSRTGVHSASSNATNTALSDRLAKSTLDCNSATASNRSPWSSRSARSTLSDLTRRFRRTFHCQPTKSSSMDASPVGPPNTDASEPVNGRSAIELSSFQANGPQEFFNYSATSIGSSRPRSPPRGNVNISRSTVADELPVVKCSTPSASPSLYHRFKRVDVSPDAPSPVPSATTFDPNRGCIDRTSLIRSDTPVISSAFDVTATPVVTDSTPATQISTRIPTWIVSSQTATHFDTHMPWSPGRGGSFLSRRPLSETPAPSTTITTTTSGSVVTSAATTSLNGETATRLASSISIPPLLNRTHIRTSPYERLSRLSYPVDASAPASSTRTHPFLKSTPRSPSTPQPAEATSLAQGSSLDPTAITLVQQNGSVPSCNVSTQFTPSVSLVSRSVAFCTDPVCSPAPPPALSTGRPRLHTECSILSGYSLASDDLMLDTDEGWTDGPDQEDEDSHVAELRDETKLSTARTNAFPPMSREPTLYSHLESVTELSLDDLSNVPTQPAASSVAQETGDNVDANPRRSILRQKKAVIPHLDKAVGTGATMSTTGIDRRRHTTSFTDTGARSLFAGLRRLRSIPGHRYRSSSTSSGSSTPYGFNDGDDLGPGTHLGERTCVLLASEQRQMFQELQGVKLTLLKLKRLLSEDQWHLPVFHEQLNLTEPGTRHRSRQQLPQEWIVNRSGEDSTNVTPAQRSRTCSDSGVAPAPYSASLTGSSDGQMAMDAAGDRFSDLYQTDSAPLSPDSAGLSKLLGNLAQLQKENRQLYVTRDCATKPVSDRSACYQTLDSDRVMF